MVEYNKKQRDFIYSKLLHFQSCEHRQDYSSYEQDDNVIYQQVAVDTFQDLAQFQHLIQDTLSSNTCNNPLKDNLYFAKILLEANQVGGLV